MKNLINFILRNVHWLLFFILLVVSVFLMIQNNQFQRSRYLSFFHEISGRIQLVSNPVRSYIGLRRSNAELLEQLAFTQTQLNYYKDKYYEYGSDSIPSLLPEDINLEFIPALVVNSRIFGNDNYITINKGSEDGLKPDMGVTSAYGIVGVVMNSVSSHFARVIPLLNPAFRPNCKIKRTNYSGPMIWDGKDSRYSYLQELPRHAVYEVGDTIVTSGLSTIFPEGLPVGIVVGSRKDKNDDYTSLKVKLFTDFGNLRELMVISNHLQEEQINLEQGTEK
ncbi:rod shape-determining protein MreC [Bacteroidales bacterium OttesenSCG-928-A17]|nr:rod shape-determining protein MreC [Bacteroidales bacterium OttesenSCG-928-A17]